jgi:signal recognition particle receptor subunit beta
MTHAGSALATITSPDRKVAGGVSAQAGVVRNTAITMLFMLAIYNLGTRMVLFNNATKEITAKVVYYGPGLCGKTTNLQFIYESLPSNNRSKMLSLATRTDRTLFFDFLPLDLGKIRGMRMRLQLYTVPGQVYYNSTRQLVLKGADGVVFVADSQDGALDANLESLQNLEDNLKRQGLRLNEMPLVMQYNKRDLPNALPIPELERDVNKFKVPHVESVATTGVGVERTLKTITHLVLTHLAKKHGLKEGDHLETDIQILNPQTAAPQETVWDENDETLPLTTRASDFELADAHGAEDAPHVATELVVDSRPSVEIPLPQGILDSLPSVGSTPKAPERRVSDGLVKEVTIPLNLTADEVREHRKVKLKVTIDITII